MKLKNISKVGRLFDLGLVTRHEARQLLGLEGGTPVVGEDLIDEMIEPKRVSPGHRMWIEDCCEVGGNHTASRKELVESYRQWCERTGSAAQSTTALLRSLRNIGCQDVRMSASRRGLSGLRIKRGPQ